MIYTDFYVKEKLKYTPLFIVRYSCRITEH